MWLANLQRVADVEGFDCPLSDLWILGLSTNMTFGGLVDLLLVSALVVFVFKLVTDRRKV